MKKKKLKAKIKHLERELETKRNFINSTFDDIDKMLSGDYPKIEEYKAVLRCRKQTETSLLIGSIIDNQRHINELSFLVDREVKGAGITAQIKKQAPIPNDDVSEKDFKDVVSQIPDDKRTIIVVAKDEADFYEFIHDQFGGCYNSVPDGYVLARNKIYIPIINLSDISKVDNFDSVDYTIDAIKNPEILEIKRQIQDKRHEKHYRKGGYVVEGSTLPKDYFKNAKKQDINLRMD